MESKWFEEWREPRVVFRAAHKGILACYGADTTPPQHLRNAYVAGLFACIWQDACGPCEVQLVPESEQFPDAKLKTGSTVLDLEVTMALGANKKMFKEWREGRAKAKRGEIVYSESTEQRQANAREAIPRVVGEKAGRHYTASPKLTLLVYADDGRALSPKEMAELTEPWKDCFRDIYLLCGMDAVRVWPTRCVLSGKEPPWAS